MSMSGYVCIPNLTCRATERVRRRVLKQGAIFTDRLNGREMQGSLAWKGRTQLVATCADIGKNW